MQNLTLRERAHILIIAAVNSGHNVYYPTPVHPCIDYRVCKSSSDHSTTYTVQARYSTFQSQKRGGSAPIW